MLNRFSLSTVVLDHWRSLRVLTTGRPDFAARAAITVLPVGVAVAALVLGWRIGEPTDLLPATALLAAVLLSAVGQLVNLRARIADSVLLSGNKRVTGHLRESVSGILLAAVAALANAAVLGVLALLPPKGDKRLHLILSAVALALSTYLVLMFISTARRLYTTYLEAFEGGLALEKPRRQRRSGHDSEIASPAAPDRQDPVASWAPPRSPEA